MTMTMFIGGDALTLLEWSYPTFNTPHEFQGLAGYVGFSSFLHGSNVPIGRGSARSTAEILDSRKCPGPKSVKMSQQTTREQIRNAPDKPEQMIQENETGDDVNMDNAGSENVDSQWSATTILAALVSV